MVVVQATWLLSSAANLRMTKSLLGFAVELSIKNRCSFVGSII